VVLSLTLAALAAVPSAVTGPRVATVAGATVAGATVTGPPGKWTRITDTNLRNIDEVGLARTSDGVLHVVWPADVGPLDKAVMHTAISPDGTAGTATTVATGLHSLGNPDVVVEPSGGLRAFFGATTGANETDGIRTATAGSDGASWTAQGPRASNSKQPDDVGAAVTSSGTPIFAWAISFSLYVHSGINSATADLDLREETECCDYDPDLATDATSGETFVAWYSNADGERGTWVQQVAPTQGQKTFVPGSADNRDAIHPLNRVQIAARVGGPGVFVAYCGEYPTCERARLWEIGSGKPMAVGRGADVESVGVSAGPRGRLWVFWQDGAVIKAARSNPAATKTGAIVKVKPPKGTDSLWRVGGEGSLGPLDLFAHVSTGSSLATWHTQVKPGLTLRCSGGKVVGCTVSDAGDPVAGAKVKIGGKTLTSNAKGKVSVNLPPGTFVAKATKGGYTSTSTRVKSK
jgi:hypothetical protein